MPLHIVKLAVGAETVEDLAAWQALCLKRSASRRGGPRLVHTTFQTPKRQDEVLDGGSLYWVVKGVVSVRQRLLGFDEGRKEDGSKCCLFVLDPDLVPVRGKRRRPFQGWRYLKDADAPADYSSTGAEEAKKLPAAMRRELAELGLL
ncbi:MAG: DUF1489 domain-containing protein [Pseudomonadota bacterium]